MRILLVVKGGVHHSGTHKVIPALLDLIERLSRRHDVTCVCIDQYPDYCTYDLLGARIINLGTSRLKGGTMLVNWTRMMSTLRDLPRFDLIHAFGAGNASAVALGAAHMQQIPLVLTLVGGELTHIPEISYGSGHGVLLRQTMAALKRAAVVTCMSTTAREQIPATIRAEVVPFGPDLDLFDNEPDRPPGPPWRLLQVATINQVKGPFVLMDALKLVCREMDEVVLDWVGEDILDGAVAERAAELGISDHVMFHGFRPIRELPPFYNEAHLLLNSSFAEGQPVATSEAAACGLATIGTEVGLMAQLQKIGAAATVPIGDPDALAAAIIDLLGDERHRIQIGTRARNWVRSHDADWTARRFEEIYAEVLS